MTSPTKALQTEFTKNDSTLGKISFDETISHRTESSTSKTFHGTAGTFFDRLALRWDEYEALRRYFLEADGRCSDKYCTKIATVDLLTAEFRLEDMNPFEILDLHYALLQLCDSVAEVAETESSSGFDEGGYEGNSPTQVQNRLAY